jgi:hypothetical protein
MVHRRGSRLGELAELFFMAFDAFGECFDGCAGERFRSTVQSRFGYRFVGFGVRRRWRVVVGSGSASPG